MMLLQNLVCREKGQWQCGLVNKRNLEPSCDTDASKFSGAFDAFEVVPLNSVLKLIILQTVLVTNAALPMCWSNWRMILNLTTQRWKSKSMKLQSVLLGR